jgi:hypothetical protein
VSSRGTWICSSEVAMHQGYAIGIEAPERYKLVRSHIV